MKPLRHRRILVTRRNDQAGPLVETLSVLGATVVEVPLLALAPPEDPAPLEAALARLGGYDWLAFTSANAVVAVAGHLDGLGQALPAPLRLASVGPTTTREIAARFAGRQPDLQPVSQYRAEGLLEAFRALDLGGSRVLLPVSDLALDVLAEGLRARAARVDVVVAYRTIVEASAEPAVRGALDSERIDLVTLASPSAVRAFALAAGGRAREVPVAVMGPVTAEAARRAGLDVRAVAEPSTAEGLVAAIVACLGRAPARR
ncbi:MAG: uroporphyrinogen-III synthase [Acidobacteria bacterium]|nr:MAG: uroporphyrinogen-III synthase [Acidobacteriota bacterium]